MSEFSFIQKLLQKDVKETIKAHISGTDYKPVVVEIDPTTYCNLNCKECVNKDLLNQSAFSVQALESIIKNLRKANVRNIIFIGGGEPLVYPEIEYILRLCKSEGIAVGLVTNGLLLAKYAEVISETVSWVRVSLDAGSRETYMEIKGMDVFEEVLQGIKKVCSQPTKIKVGCSFLVIESKDAEGNVWSNVDELIKAAQVVQKAGCDYFEFKPLVNTKHDLYQYTDETMQKIREATQELQARTDVPRIIYPKSIDSILSGIYTQPKAYHNCPMCYLRALITPHGIYPCPHKRGVEERRIEESFDVPAEYWLSKERIEKIDQLIDPCKDCNFFCVRNDSNLFLHSVIAFMEKGIDILELYKEYELEDYFI